MIKFLRIRNLATIEDIRLDLDEGFSILTGETGAGKSIIIDSIRLVCGEKGSADLVRTGCAEASVEAIFSRPRQGRKSQTNASRRTSAAEEIVVQQTISGDGSGKAYCDGVLVPVKKLKELAGDLVDIYGQNDHVFLLHLDSHLDYLDQFSGTLALRENVARAAQELRRLRPVEGRMESPGARARASASISWNSRSRRSKKPTSSRRGRRSPGPAQHPQERRKDLAARRSGARRRLRRRHYRFRAFCPSSNTLWTSWPPSIRPSPR